MSSEDFKSFIVTNPDLVDEGIDVSGLNTTTDTSPFLLGNIPGGPGLQYSSIDPTRYSDLIRFYSQGLPMLDTPQAAPDFTGGEMIDTGGSGDMDQVTGGLDTTQPFQDLVDPNVNIDEFALEYQGTPGGNTGSGEFDLIDNSGKDYGPYSQTPVNTPSGNNSFGYLDGIDLDNTFVGTPVSTPSGNNPFGLEDPQSLAIGPSGAVDFGTGGLEDEGQAVGEEFADTPVSTPSGNNPFGLEDLNPSVLAGPGINNPGAFDDFADVGVDNTVDYGMPQGSPGQLNPAAPSIDNITGLNQIQDSPDMDDGIGLTEVELNQIQDQPLRDKLSSSLTSATEGLSSVAELTGDKLKEVGTSIAASIGGIFKPDGSTITVPGLGEINVKETIGGMILNKVVGGPVTLVFSAIKALAGLLPKDSLENSTKRSIAAQLTAENDYGYNMQSGNIGQDPFGRNPVSAFGNYEQTLAEDATYVGDSNFSNAKKQYAEDYFNAKSEVAGGVEQTSGISEEAGGTGIVSTGDVLGPGEFLPEGEDLVSLEDQLKSQPVTVEEISPGYSPDDDDPADDGPGATADDGFGGYEQGAFADDATGSDTSPGATGGEGGFDDNSFSDANTGFDTSPGATGGEGGSSSGGGKSIVCTMMNDFYGFGSFRNKIWLEHSKSLAPEYQKGYHKMFLPLVAYARKNGVTNKIVRKTLEHIAVHRTIDIRQESRGKTHLLGRVYRKILEPICYLVGKYAK